jgi:hypothetical protein
MSREFKPVSAAMKVYETEHCPRTFEKDLELHLRHGLVYSDNDVFVAARPVYREWPKILITDPSWYTAGPGDCWHVYLCAGMMRKLFWLAPFPLPWVSFERKNRIRFYRWKDLYDRIENGSPHSLLQGWRPGTTTGTAAAPEPDHCRRKYREVSDWDATTQSWSEYGPWRSTSGCGGLYRPSDHA